MNKKKTTQKKKTGGSPIRGNTKFMNPDFLPLEKKLSLGFPVSASSIVSYRDMIKETCAQALDKGIHNFMPQLNFDFLAFFNQICEKDCKEEIRDFYSCFYDYYSKKRDITYKASTSHYKSKDKTIITRAIKDIEVIINDHLAILYEKLTKEIDYYQINDLEIIDAVHRLKICQDVLTTICQSCRFLFLHIIPLTISEKKYNELKNLNCTIEQFYANDGNNKYYRIKKKNNTPYIYLGVEGSLFFLKRNQKRKG